MYPLTSRSIFKLIFFFNDTATTEIYTLSLHDALPISASARSARRGRRARRDARSRRGSPRSGGGRAGSSTGTCGDRKSTRLNSSHLLISYAVFCFKKKKKTNYNSSHALNTNQ